MVGRTRKFQFPKRDMVDTDVIGAVIGAYADLVSIP